MEDSFHRWEKGVAMPLSPYFNSREFSCKCSNADCINQKISKSIVNKITLVREEYGSSIRVTSAFRCEKHQNALRGSGIKTATGTSTHEKGEAVDLQPMDGDISKLLKICEKHFTSIGVANTFLHLDERTDNRRWKY